MQPSSGTFSFQERSGFEDQQAIEDSLALTEPTHVGLIFCDPGRQLFAGELPWFGEPGTLRAEPRGKEKQQFLLLLRRQRIGRSLDLCKCAHTTKNSR